MFSRRDHPRIRGEHRQSCACDRAYSGSSPHTRGARGFLLSGADRERIIPAYAGSTVWASLPMERAADHPRIRGEHFAASLAVESTEGIIPAYAGSTRGRPSPAPTRPDHPRIRGEHSATLYEVSVVAGSSPHTRGAPARHDHRRPTERIIPAYAGSTRLTRSEYARLRDHPRIRGEHAGAIGFGATAAGSSPHTRGARHGDRRNPCRPRIIPAYAGSTVDWTTVTSRVADHPRIRGEHHLRQDGQLLGAGSSPHTRGAPHAEH